MHDWAGLLPLADPANPSGVIPTSIVGLLIITAAPTIAAVAVLIRALRNRSDDGTPAPPLPMPPPTTPDGEAIRLRKQIDALRRWLERNGFDPDKIKRGTEAIDSVRIRDN